MGGEARRCAPSSPACEAPASGDFSGPGSRFGEMEIGPSKRANGLRAAPFVVEHVLCVDGGSTVLKAELVARVAALARPSLFRRSSLRHVGWRSNLLPLSCVLAVMTKSNRRPPWERPNPSKRSGKAHTKLSTAEKEEAKSRAKRAGRRYPNLVDNMQVAAERNEKSDGGHPLHRTQPSEHPPTNYSRLRIRAGLNPTSYQLIKAVEFAP